MSDPTNPEQTGVEWEALPPAQKPEKPEVQWEGGEKPVDEQTTKTGEQTGKVVFEPLGSSSETKGAKPPQVEWIGGVKEEKNK